MANAFDFRLDRTSLIAIFMPGIYEEPKESYNWMLRVFLISLRENLEVRMF